MTQATQVLSKTAKDTGDSLQNALNVKDGTQQATGNLQSVAQQIAAVNGAATGLSGTMGKLIQTGGIAMVANTFGNLAGAHSGSAHGDTAGSIASNTVSTALTGAPSADCWARWAGSYRRMKSRTTPTRTGIRVSTNMQGARQSGC